MLLQNSVNSEILQCAECIIVTSFYTTGAFIGYAHVEYLHGSTVASSVAQKSLIRESRNFHHMLLVV